MHLNNLRRLIQIKTKKAAELTAAFFRKGKTKMKKLTLINLIRY